VSDEFRVLMIGAMYENGGNTTHRLLDGHEQMHVYPFESQLGTRLVNDHLTSMFPVKYRWPVFALDAAPEADYRAIIDEEAKVRARTPHVSKFRDWPMELDDDERCAIYVRRVEKSGRSRANNVTAFFRATFEAWKDVARTGREQMLVGYSPALTVDADKVLDDLPDGHFLHVVRNPWSAYADTKKRPVPLPLPVYALAWTLNQQAALLFRALYPDRFHLVKLEDVLADPVDVLGGVCERMGLERSQTLAAPSWNGRPLDQVYPWGTIRIPTPDANRATAGELSDEEQEEIRMRTQPFLEALDYDGFLAESLAGTR
jgi:Sulfotransferase family